jgi:hypothetical protein
MSLAPCARLQQERGEHQRRIRKQQPRHTVVSPKRRATGNAAQAESADDESHGKVSSKADAYWYAWPTSLRQRLPPPPPAQKGRSRATTKTPSRIVHARKNRCPKLSNERRTRQKSHRGNRCPHRP